MVVIGVTLTVKAGAEAQAAEMLAALEAKTRAEAGCIMYIVHRSVANPRKFMVYEQYKDEAAKDFHLSSPHFQQYAANGVFPVLESREFDIYAPLASA